MVTAGQDRAARLPAPGAPTYDRVSMPRSRPLLALLLAAPALAGDDPADPGKLKLAKVELTVAHPDGSSSKLAVLHPVRPEKKPRPAVLFVHGFWVGPEMYLRSAEALASRGYVVALFDQFDRNVNDLPGWVAGGRLALDALERANGDRRSELCDRLDPARMGVIGHSYGGMTTIGIAAVDSRVKAAVALAPGAQSREVFLRAAESIQDCPVLVITTERDATCPSASWGRPAWELIPDRRKLFLEVAKGDHLTQSDAPSFGGNGPRRASRRYAHAWLDRWLLEAEDAAGWTDGRRAAKDPDLSARAVPTQDPEALTVTAESLNVRAGPGASHPVVTTLARGARVRVLERRGTWCRVEWEGAPAGELWVAGGYLRG